MRVIISGGGTGGHIYPALALIERLRERQLLDDVLYVGTKRGLESRIVPDHHIPFTTLEIQGFKRSLSLDNLKTIELFLKSVRQAKKIIQDFKPDIVIGTGGYVCAAIVYEAHRLHIPTIIHEQNSVAGITNKFLSHFVDKVAITFPEVAHDFPKHKVVLTGNPRAQQVAAMQPNDKLSEYGLNSKLPTVLIIGGSRGAERINQAFIEAAPAFTNRVYQVLFATGQVHFQDVAKQLRDIHLTNNVKVVPYIDNMPTILPDLAAIVSRAGATSLAEITALGIPSILIPSPYVTNNHQMKNAMSLVKNDAALMITEDDLTGATLLANTDKLMQDVQLRQQMGNRARKLGYPDAADRIIKIMQQLVH